MGSTLLGTRAPSAPATSLVRACPVCGGTSAQAIHRQRFALPDDHPLAAGYTVVCCERCGTGFADCAVPQEAYDAYYAGLSKYEDAPATGSGLSAFDAVRIDALAQQLAAQCPAGARVLDVGCANGGVLRALRGRGFGELIGLDPATACVRTTAQIDGVRAVQGALGAMPEGLGRFDLVILSHVLEHVRDLDDALRAVRRVLAPGGLVYVEVPDAMRYGDDLAAPFQDFNTEHINHFSQATLTTLMARRGLGLVAGATKTIESAPGVPYPALFGFYTPQVGLRPPVRRDDALPAALRGYTRASAALMTRMDATLREALRDAPEVLVWGTGQLTMKLLTETALGDARIVAFVDSNAVNQDRRLRDAPILRPAQALEFDQPIVVASTIHQDAIVTTLREHLRAPNRLILLGAQDRAAA